MPKRVLQSDHQITRYADYRSVQPVQVPTLPPTAFGADAWKKYFGDVGVEPPLPPDIDQILSSPCPFWPSKKVHETHLLVLVPQTVGGQPLTFKILGELVKNPLQGSSTQYKGFYLGNYIESAAPSSHWVLLTRDVIEGSRNKSYSDQQTLVSKKGQGVYTVPTILDATVCIFMEHVRSGTKLYGDRPLTFTRCQEKYRAESDANWHLVVGGFAPEGHSGLVVINRSGVHEKHGVGGCRKL